MEGKSVLEASGHFYGKLPLIIETETWKYISYLEAF